ncbi:unnamed protein product, partial [Medioppia subpectinata]
MSDVWTPDSEDTPNDNTMISHEAIDKHIINDSIDPRLADQLADKELFLNNQQKFKLATVSIVRHINNFSVCFNEFEINKIRELLTAVKWIREPTGNTITGELADLVQYKMTMATRFDRLIQNFIKMTKQLNPFNNLCGNDMIALIKYGCIENLLMRSLEYYNQKDRYWTINTGCNSSLLLKLDFTAKCEPLMGDCYIRYFEIMCPEWDSDELIMDLEWILSDCPKCRLNKCFEIGMKKEWILSDEEREVMRQKVEENRQKRRKTEMTTNSSTDNQRYNNNSNNFYENIETIVSQNTYNNNRLNEVNRNTVNTSAGDLSLDFNSICDDFEMFEPTIAAAAGESTKSLNIDHIFGDKSLFPNTSLGFNSPGDHSVVPIGRPITDHNRDFNETEGQCLYELLNALMLLKDPEPQHAKETEGQCLYELLNALMLLKDPEPQHAKEVTSYWELCEWMVIKFDSMIRDIIRLSKRLAAFQTLDEHDKQILIKNSCVEIILIRSAVVYDYELGFWDIFVV